MIKLLCRKCGSENLEPIQEATLNMYFMCSDCDDVLPMQELDWEQYKKVEI